MPNWCNNILIVTGDEKILAEFTTKAASAEVGERDTAADFTFEAFLPMPPELAAMHTGSTTINGVRFSNWIVKPGGIEVGMGAAECKALRAQYGFINWYDRNCAVLGTKWDVTGTLAVTRDKRRVFTFDSAWGPPTEGIEAVSKQYPTLKFVLQWGGSEMDGSGSYHVRNGELLRQTTGPHRSNI